MSAPPDLAVARLLRDLFAVEELQRFLRAHYREIADELPINMGIVPLAVAAAEALARHNLIDDDLFRHLVSTRPRCVRQIVLAAQSCRGAVRPRAVRRFSWRGGLVAALGVAAAIALMIDRFSGDAAPLNCEEDRCGAHQEGSAKEPSHDIPKRVSCPAEMRRIAMNGGASSLCVDRTEVTRGAFCGSRASHQSSRWSESPERCKPDPAVARWSDHPITMVRRDEAEAFCEERGLRLLQRGEFVQILVIELRGRPLESLLTAMNVCDADYLRGRTEEPSFTHHDGHSATAPVGSYREVFASPTGLDDMFGNVREIVLDGGAAYACGSSYLSYQLDDLGPEHCLSSQNPPLAVNQGKPTLGFRCAGESSDVSVGPDA